MSSPSKSSRFPGESGSLSNSSNVNSVVVPMPLFSVHLREELNVPSLIEFADCFQPLTQATHLQPPIVWAKELLTRQDGADGNHCRAFPAIPFRQKLAFPLSFDRRAVCGPFRR